MSSAALEVPPEFTRPLLSIAIPSHNSSELLRGAVESILADSAFDPERVEVCVSDNSPTDQSRVLMTECFGNLPGFRYRRSLDAPSLDENVAAAARYARGYYVWLFGDDDLLVPGALGDLLDVLATREHAVVVVNSASFDDSGTVEARRLPSETDRLYAPTDDDAFLRDLGSYLTYVGAIVVKRDLWETCYDQQAVGSFFAHVATVCTIKIGRSAYAMMRPGIAMRLHRQTWTARHFEIWNLFYPRIIWGLAGFSDAAKAAVIRQRPLKSMSRLIASRAYGRFSLEVWRAVVRPAGDIDGASKALALAAALVPQGLARSAYIGYIQLFRRQHTPSFSPALALAQLRATSR